MLKIVLPNSQRLRLAAKLTLAGSREIGGVLMGEQLAPDFFQVVDFSVDDQSGSAAHFVRTPEYHAAALEAFHRRTGSDYRRFNYLGEWHSHPSYPVRPSPQDICSMQGLVDGERDIEFSALLIFRLRFFHRLEIGSYMFIRNAEPRHVEMLRSAIH